MIDKYFFEKNKLIINCNGQYLEKAFILDIGQVVKNSESTLIVRLVSDKANNQNVFCIDDTGSLVWTMQDPDEYQNGGCKHTKCAITSIWLENGKLVAGSWDGYDYFLDSATGKISSDRFVK